MIQICVLSEESIKQLRGFKLLGSESLKGIKI